MTSLESQIRLLLRAWPITDRRERGDEILGTTLESVTEGRTRIPLSLAVNLVIGGIRARWRLRPPVWWWLYYRVGGRLPAKWRPWVLHDLTDPGWRRRIVANRLSTGLIAVLLANVVGRAIVHSPTVRHGAVSSL